ncbi:MAG TPA: Spy/CpxP family protein refolding chaperone [Thermoanaerobaculia bacterium]|jgi:Spy/CpxP family protein refolding chaperone
MKNKWIAAAGVLALSATMAMAAPHNGFGGRHGRRGGEHGARFAEKLNLTDAQKQQIRDIKKETRAQNAAFFDSFRANMQQFREAKRSNDTAKADALKPTLEAQREQMKQIRQAERTRVLSVLTADQRAQLEQWKAQRQKRR